MRELVEARQGDSTLSLGTLHLLHRRDRDAGPRRVLRLRQAERRADLAHPASARHGAVLHARKGSCFARDTCALAQRPAMRDGFLAGGLVGHGGSPSDGCLKTSYRPGAPESNAGGGNAGGEVAYLSSMTKMSTLEPTVRVHSIRLPSAEKTGLVQEPRPSTPSPKVTRVGFEPSRSAT